MIFFYFCIFIAIANSFALLVAILSGNQYTSALHSGILVAMAILALGCYDPKYKSECIICGKRGFRMNSDDDGRGYGKIYCKRHWEFYEPEEFKWCQRCGGTSFGKEFCLDCRDRLAIFNNSRFMEKKNA